ncbi:hypothetical protein [Nocardia otitidiscaviarum]|uniref:hypothetical protein n=1 Tax=Nocardia otitidiscaviarum TaxID=1823 RepID=UPI001E2DB660|nr:hypothetical protein [Nocardia otitidiscaviarum]
MRTRRILQAILLGGALVAVTACENAEPGPPPGTTAPTVTVTAPPSGGPTVVPGVTNPSAPAATRTDPRTTVTPSQDSEPPRGSGTVVIRTASLSGTAIPYVPVELALFRPCDPLAHDLPEGTPEAERWTATTGIDGQAAFSVPVGCYRFGMNPPPGTDPVPEGMHTLFVESDGQTVFGSLRFQDPAPEPVCAAQTIVHDLGAGPPFTTATPSVAYCDRSWAVIAWDIPGDSQRMVRRVDGAPWTTYVYFPNDVCRAQARADGVPVGLEEYFPVC